jgi:hypothetical protein
MKKQKILLSLTAVFLTGTALFAVIPVHAQTPTVTSPRMNFFQEFIQFIAQKFGLDKTQVQSAVTDFQNQKKATITPRPTLTQQQITDREKTRLDSLVTDGKITPEQETAIIDELALLHSKYGFAAMQNLTPDQRKAQMTARQNDILAWAKSTGIDSSYLTGFGLGGKGFGMMGGRGMMGWGRGWGGPWDGDDKPAPTP